MTKKDRKRFWAKVRVDSSTGCWIWTAAIRTWKAEPWDGGYGAFKVRGRVFRAHIVAFWILFGCRVPRGKVLLHGCDNRRCVNVLAHIRPGTQLQNVAEMHAKGRSIQQRRKGTLQNRETHEKDQEVMAPDGSVEVGTPRP